MKIIKALSLMLAIILLVFTVSCNLPTDFENEPSFNDIESVESNEIDTASEKISDTSERILDDSEGMPFSYIFSCAEDMHTYITTGSTDSSDYLSTSYTSDFINYPSPEIMKIGYLPIIALFDLDESGCNGISETDFTAIPKQHRFGYFFWDNGPYSCLELYISYALEEQDESNTNIGSNTTIYDKMSAKDEHDECVIRQNINGTTVYYSTIHGKIFRVKFEYGNHSIKMTNGVTHKETAAVYNTFMTSPETAAFAPFFSEDQAVREEAFAKFEANYAEIVNRAE